MNLRVGVAGRRSWSISISEGATGEGIRRIPGSCDVGHVEVEISYVVEPLIIHLIQVMVRLQPRDHLIVRLQVEIRHTSRWSRGATAQDIMQQLENAECMYYCRGQELKDVGQVRSLRRCQLSTLVGDWVLVSVVIRLCQDCRHCDSACVCRQDCSSGRIKCSKDWRRR